MTMLRFVFLLDFPPRLLREGAGNRKLQFSEGIMIPVPFSLLGSPIVRNAIMEKLFTNKKSVNSPIYLPIQICPFLSRAVKRLYR